MMENIFIVSCVAVGIIFLQIFLSRQRSKWFGLVLPIIFFLFSLLAALLIVLFHTSSKIGLGVIEAVANAIYVSLYFSVPAVILLAIYYILQKRKPYAKYSKYSEEVQIDSSSRNKK